METHEDEPQVVKKKSKSKKKKSSPPPEVEPVPVQPEPRPATPELVPQPEASTEEEVKVKSPKKKQKKERSKTQAQVGGFYGHRSRFMSKSFERKIVIIFISISLNTCFGFSKELSHWDSSFEYPQNIFWLRNNFQLSTLIWRCDSEG